MTDYIELHCHSAFSLLDGASLPETLIERAHDLGYPALALTDHDELGGAVAFSQAAEQVGMDAIIGAEVSVGIRAGARLRADGLGIRRDVSGAESRIHPPASGHPPESRSTHLVLLAESREGYGNLSTLITRARMGNPRGEPNVSLDLLASHASGLFALTGCQRGWVPSLVADGDVDGACEATAVLLDIFGGRVAVECWDHGLPEEREAVAHLLHIARSLGIPWVVTNNVHYAKPAGRLINDVVSCLRHDKTLDEMGTRLRPNGEWYLKSAAQMQRRWQHAPEGIRATAEIAKRCAFRLKELTPSLPAFPLPSGVSADEYLARLVEQGAWERWGLGIRDSGFGIGDSGLGTRDSEPATRDSQLGTRNSELGTRNALSSPESRVPSPQHHRQIAHELGVIRRLGLAGYFLIVWDIVRFARREGILCQGRGSAANSAVCFCLGITAVDPIKMELLFERFLSEERQEAPDIDLDFSHRERERVIQYVYERYGREHAGMVCEQITYRGRSAVRDAARVLGFSVEQAAKLALFSDRFSARATAEALRTGDAEFDEGAAERPEKGISKRWNHERYGWSEAEALGGALVHGTEAATRAREEKLAARRIDRNAEKDAGRERARAGEPMTSADRPHPKAAYEPYGSPSAQHSGSALGERNPSLLPPPSSLLPAFSDPYASDDHVERRNPTTALRSTSDQSSLLRRAGLDPNDRRVRMLAEVVDGLHQLPRHRSIHVGGFVLTREPLSTVVPIEPASMENRTVIQWEKDDLDPVGLVKIDLLGLGMLTLIQDCLKYVRQTRGITIDLARLDMTDQAVYDDLCSADTIGVFQVESRAQMQTLPRLKPRCFYDLVVEVAIIRPGPIQGDMVHPYLRRRAGEEPVTYPHPALEPILKRTLGVPLFQEQGMQVAIAAAGFTPGEADNLRRAMGHKRSRERMAAICEKLVAGMKRNNIPEETARKIYNQINAFADYGFPESHAASFALLVYASAYLKHYYPPEFLAAILNAQPMGFYAPGTLIEDARRHGVEVRPVDLMQSGWDAGLEKGDRDSGFGRVPACGRMDSRNFESRFTNPESRFTNPESPIRAVRLGLRSIRGLGDKARDELEHALRDGGPFCSIEDVVRRSGLDRRSLRYLAEGGAFDSMLPDEPNERKRRAAIWRMLEAFRGDAGPLAPSRPRPEVSPRVPPMTPLEITEADYRVTGLSLNGHPMRHLREILAPNGVRTAKEVLASRDGEKVATAGLVICRQRPGTAKGFVFLTLEDETGLVNVVVMPKRFERQALLISTAPLLLVRGTLQVEGTVVNLRGEQFRELKAQVGAEWAPGHDFH